MWKVSPLISSEELKEIRRVQGLLLKLPLSRRVGDPHTIIRLLDMIEELQLELKPKEMV